MIRSKTRLISPQKPSKTNVQLRKCPKCINSFQHDTGSAVPEIKRYFVDGRINNSPDLEQEADRFARHATRNDMHPSDMRMNSITGKATASQKKAEDFKLLNGSSDIVEDVITLPGRHLSSNVKSFMEERFNHDFSQVRVHTDENGAKSAERLNAQAYTLGNNIVFAAGKYSPDTKEGKGLLAHELAHVMQQESSSPVLQRRSIFQEIRGLFRGDDFSEEDLQNYLVRLDHGEPEGYTDSDNKARAIVASWRRGGSNYVLTARRKALMIREMQSGFCGDDDEDAILEILERSYNFELSEIFGSGGINARDLNSDFQGYQYYYLERFYQRRFQGGMEALLRGEIQPKGNAVPLGERLDRADEPIDAALPGAVRGWNETCVLGILCSEDRPVIDRLSRIRVKIFDSIDVDKWSFHDGHWSSEVVHPVGVANSEENLLGLVREKPCHSAAQTFIHEVRHLAQPSAQTRYQSEIDAYTFAESWSIARGLPGNPGLRMQEEGGEVPDPENIDQYVRRRYGGPEQTPGDELIGHSQNGDAIIRRPDPDRSTYNREPNEGDVYLANPPRYNNETTIPGRAWRCPLDQDRPVH